MPKPKGERSQERRRHRRHKKDAGDLPQLEKIAPSDRKRKSRSKGGRGKGRLHRKTVASTLEADTGFPARRKDLQTKEKLFTVRSPTEATKDAAEKELKTKGRRRRLKKLNHEKRPVTESGMAAGDGKDLDRGRKKGTSNKARKKPHSLPPLPKTPKSPISTVQSADAQSLRRFIGSPPPSGLLNRSPSANGSALLDSSSSPASEGLARRMSLDGSERSFLNDEFTVYSPTDSLDQSHPKITIASAPLSAPEEGGEGEDYTQSRGEDSESASPLGRSIASLSSLVASAKSLNLNDSLSLPPKLLSYMAEDGSTVVQEYVSEDRLDQLSSPRRSSTPSIRDLPSPLQGVSPLQITPKPPKSKLKKPKLSPLPRR